MRYSLPTLSGASPVADGRGLLETCWAEPHSIPLSSGSGGRGRPPLQDCLPGEQKCLYLPFSLTCAFPLAQRTLVGLVRDLRGIAFAFNAKTSFMMLFEWMYP